MTKSPMSGRVVLTVALGILLLTVAVVAGLWWWVGGLASPESATPRLDALRIGLSVGLGGGGAFALYLAWRRQRSTEETLAHQQQVAAATEEDALERRITDLYIKAVEQLGSDKAPVRLGGLYALERLAQNYREQRQTIVNVLCAYLRMPFHPPETDEQHERVEEREVRLAAQRILTTHLRRRGARFWPNINLDLTGATLIDFDLSECRVGLVSMCRATLHGGVSFNSTVFTRAEFDGALFARGATFDDAVFEQGASFYRARFALGAWLRDAKFSGMALFSEARFQHGACFLGAGFSDAALFDRVTFTHEASFGQARFADLVRFRDAEFKSAKFDGATFDKGVPPELVPFVDRAAGGS